MSTEVSTWQIPSFDSRKVEPKILAEEEKKKGFEQGYQEGIHKAQAEYTERLATLEECISKLPGFDQLIQDSLHQTIMNFVQTLLLKTVQYELLNSKDFLVAWIEKGISYLQDQSTVQLKINPMYVKDLEGPLREYFSLKKIECIPDPNVALCQIILKSPTETLSSKLDEWINQSSESKNDSKPT